VFSYQPLLGIQAAVTEKTMSGADFAPGEALSVEEAIGLYTRNAAHAAFDGHIKGTVAPGKYADLTVLTEDPRAVPPEAIAAITVTATIQEASSPMKPRSADGEWAHMSELEAREALP
jgi:predicted amidohydrolase YtcJ